jgi:PHP family Zn ribbon phosphoesterase
MVSTAIHNIREDKINITPGYDGVFGKLNLIESGSKLTETVKKQKSILEFK